MKFTKEEQLILLSALAFYQQQSKYFVFDEKISDNIQKLVEKLLDCE